MSEAEFEAAVTAVKDFKPSKTVPNERKLILYGLFKQAKEGDVNTVKPGMLGGFEARAKWDAWAAVKGKSKEDCWKEYVAEFEKQKQDFA